MAESYGQVHTGGVAPTQDAYKSDFGSTEVNSAITGVANESLGSHLDWDDDDRGCMDIQALLSEFGDFGDFFENDVLPFGEVRYYCLKMPFALALSFCPSVYILIFFFFLYLFTYFLIWIRKVFVHVPVYQSSGDLKSH